MADPNRCQCLSSDGAVRALAPHWETRARARPRTAAWGSSSSLALAASFPQRVCSPSSSGSYPKISSRASQPRFLGLGIRPSATRVSSSKRSRGREPVLRISAAREDRLSSPPESSGGSSDVSMTGWGSAPSSLAAGGVPSEGSLVSSPRGVRLSSLGEPYGTGPPVTNSSRSGGGIGSGGSSISGSGYSKISGCSW